MICIIDCGTDWLEEIKENITKLDYPFKVVNLHEIGDCNFESFSGIIISGAKTLLTEVNLKEYLQPFRCIKETKIPVLGICLGHQVVGLLYGSDIFHGKMIDRKEQIEILKQDSLFSDIENNSPFREEHSEYITLPEGFVLLAKSGTCNNEAMRHEQKKIYGVQFHPEVSGDCGRKIFRNLLYMCRK